MSTTVIVIKMLHLSSSHLPWESHKDEDDGDDDVKDDENNDGDGKDNDNDEDKTW